MNSIFDNFLRYFKYFYQSIISLFGRESAILRVHVQHFKNDSTNGWRGFDVSRFCVVGFIFG